jgi:hypothetical protein
MSATTLLSEPVFALLSLYFLKPAAAAPQPHANSVATSSFSKLSQNFGSIRLA